MFLRIYKKIYKRKSIFALVILLLISFTIFFSPSLNTIQDSDIQHHHNNNNNKNNNNNNNHRQQQQHKQQNVEDVDTSSLPIFITPDDTFKDENNNNNIDIKEEDIIIPFQEQTTETTAIAMDEDIFFRQQTTEEAALYNQTETIYKDILLLDGTFYYNDKALDSCKHLNCRITRDRDKISSSAAVVFYAPTAKMNNHPDPMIKYFSNQLYVAVTMEAPSYYPQVAHLSSGFNITYGYSYSLSQSNSHNYRYLPYGPLPSTFSLWYTQNKLPILPLSEDQFQILTAKRQYNMMFITSNCNDKIGRVEIARKIMRIMKARHSIIPMEPPLLLHSFGKCLQTRIVREKGTVKTKSKQKVFLMRKYKFVLAIENSECPDYVTEKLWQPLSTGTIPVYLGAPNIDKYLPHPKAIINIRDFPSVNKLVDYLQQVASNDTLRLQHLEWLRQPLSPQFIQLLNASKLNSDNNIYCNICQSIDDVNNKGIRYSAPVTSQEECKSTPYHIPFIINNKRNKH